MHKIKLNIKKEVKIKKEKEKEKEKEKPDCETFPWARVEWGWTCSWRTLVCERSVYPLCDRETPPTKINNHNHLHHNTVNLSIHVYCVLCIVYCVQLGSWNIEAHMQMQQWVIKMSSEYWRSDRVKGVNLQDVNDASRVLRRHVAQLQPSRLAQVAQQNQTVHLRLFLLRASHHTSFSTEHMHRWARSDPQGGQLPAGRGVAGGSKRG